MKFKYLLIIFLLIQNIFGQAEYKMLDAFASGSTADTFISAEFFNYSDNGSEQIAYYFANKNEWHVLVRDTAGNNYAKFSGQIDTGKTIQKMKLFYYNNELYLTLVSKIDSIKIKLYVISLVTNQTIDSIEVNPLNYVDYNFPYNELEFNSLKVIKANNGNEQILIGYTGRGSDHSAGVTWYASESKMLIFNFSDSLIFLSFLKNSSNFFSTSNISYGYKSASDYWNGSSSGSEVFSIYRMNNTNTITEGERLFSDSSSFSSNNTVISSDDSTNWSHPLVFNNCRYLSAISLSNGIVVWQKILYSLDTCGFTVSSNLTVKDHYYVIGFSNYRMWIINRDNGQQLYNEYGIISPVKILESGDNKLYYLVKAGQQTYALYELENFNSIVSVKKDKPDIPDKFLVMQNYPNPFNPSTIIKYSIPKSENVTLKIYDVLGRQIATLVNEEKPAGDYQVEFDGSNLPSGIYFYQIQAGNFIETKKMLLIK